MAHARSFFAAHIMLNAARTAVRGSLPRNESRDNPCGLTTIPAPVRRTVARNLRKKAAPLRLRGAFTTGRPQVVYFTLFTFITIGDEPDSP